MLKTKFFRNFYMIYNTNFKDKKQRLWLEVHL